MTAGRIPEATFMARTYLPSAMGRLVALWKKDLAKVSTKVKCVLSSLFAWWLGRSVIYRTSLLRVLYFFFFEVSSYKLKEGK